jgi:PAS domain S-box-containing protein
MKILLVDDDANLLELVRRFLEREGEMEIETSMSGPDAMDRLVKNRYDAIVLDYELPGMNGIDFLKRAKARGDDTPIIIFTGKGREEVVIKALNYGADYYLQKRGDPHLNFLELLYKIREAVRRHEAGKELRESERRFRESLENVHLIAFQLDMSGNLTFINDFFLALTGLEREDVLGRCWVDLFVPHEERPEVSRAFGKAMTGDRTSSYFTCTIQDEGGQSRRISLNCTLLCNPLGEFVGLSAIGEEITERERILKEKTRTEERLETLFSKAPYAYFITDLKGTFVDGNRAAEALVGYTRDELIGRNFLETGLLPPQEVPKAIGLLARHVEAEPTGPEEFVLNRKDGSQVIVEIRNVPVRIQGTSLVLGSAHDVTGRHQAEESLRRMNAKMTLLNIITRHDILNAVTALLLYLELLEEDPKDDAQREIFSKVEILAQTIKRQIEFTKLYQDIGIQSPQWQPVSQIIAREAVSAGLHGISVRSDIEHLEVYADPLLENVFHNLIDNSMRHGGGVTSVWLTALHDEIGEKIVYEDNGQGIAAREKEDIFKRGYGKNTGFGLFLSREILGITGLSIKETGTFGKGARFEIRVPHGCYREAGKE